MCFQRERYDKSHSEMLAKEFFSLSLRKKLKIDFLFSYWEQYFMEESYDSECAEVYPVAQKSTHL